MVNIPYIEKESQLDLKDFLSKSSITILKKQKAHQ